MSGFLKNVSGVKRLRIAVAGQDANDLDLPPNQVIFDSEAFDTLPIYASGSFTVSANEATWTRRVTYPALAKVPLTIYRAKIGGFYNSINVVSTDAQMAVRSTADGIFSSCYNITFPVIISYIVFEKGLR